MVVAHANRIDFFTKILLATRIALVFLPQYGYIHADEFFQSTEISAGDILRVKSYRPWEFTVDKPIRSIIFVQLFGALPFSILKYFFEATPYLLLILPRLVACLLSFSVDFAAYKLSGISAVKITASSYIALTYFTRTFSNLTETILFSLLMYLCFTPVYSSVQKTKNEPSTSSEGTATRTGLRSQKQKSTSEPPKPELLSPAEDGRTFLISCTLAAGFFNRPTFLCFALVPIVYRYGKSTISSLIFSCLILAICAIPACLFFIVVDSMYYSDGMIFLEDPLNHFVITPLNFLLYNSQSSNLATHGLHPNWLHFVVNIPLLFGPHCLHLYFDIVRVARRPLLMTRSDLFFLTCIISPLVFLSIFPHQEPRFLLPLLVPFACVYAPKILRSQRSQFVWLIVNIFLFIFYGLLHQASIVPMMFNANSIRGNIIFYQTYMPPRHLAMFHEGKITDLKEAPVSQLEKVLRNEYSGYLVYPSSIEDSIGDSLTRNKCGVDYERSVSLWPHFHTEFLSDVYQACGTDIMCLLVDSMMLKMIKFRCDPIM